MIRSIAGLIAVIYVGMSSFVLAEDMGLGKYSRDQTRLAWDVR